MINRRGFFRMAAGAFAIGITTTALPSQSDWDLWRLQGSIRPLRGPVEFMQIRRAKHGMVVNLNDCFPFFWSATDART